ncbi:FAST kinase domain-containing protein 4-like [Mantella aurantiaca]
MAFRLIQRASRLLAVPVSFQAPPSECVRVVQLGPRSRCRAALHSSPLCRLPDSQPEASPSSGSQEDEEFLLMLKKLPGVEGLLEFSRQQDFTGNRAVMVIQQIVMSENRDPEKIRNDPRFQEILQNVHRKIQYVWNTRLGMLLKSLYTLGLHRDDQYLNSVEIEVRWRLRRLTIGNLSYLANFLPVAPRSRNGTSLHSDLVKEVEYRWIEIRDARTLVSLVTRLGPTSDSLMEKLEDKVLEFAEQLSPEESRRIISSLGTQHRRTLSVLRVLSFYLLHSKSELSPPIILDLAHAFAKLNYYNPELLQKMVTDIMPKLRELKPKDVTYLVRSIALLRFPNQLFCEAVAQGCVERRELFSPAHLCHILKGFATLNFQPSHMEDFLNVVQQSLADLDSLPWHLSLEAVWSLCVLDHSAAAHFQKVLVPQFYDQILAESSVRSVGFCLKLLNINAAARLESPGYEGPLLPDHVVQKLLEKIPPRNPSNLQRKVRDALKAVFPDEETRNFSVPTVYGCRIDGEVVVDSELKALPLKDFVAPHCLQSTGTRPLPEGARRVAFIVREFSHFMFRGRDLQGQYVMNNRHLQAAGFLVVEVPYYDWQEIKTEGQKLFFLREQLKKTIAEETVP